MSIKYKFQKNVCVTRKILSDEKEDDIVIFKLLDSGYAETKLLAVGETPPERVLYLTLGVGTKPRQTELQDNVWIEYIFESSNVQMEMFKFQLRKVPDRSFCKVSNIRHKDFHSSIRPSSRSGYPPWILKRGGLVSSGQRLISSIGKTKGIAFIYFFSAKKNFFKNV